MEELDFLLEQLAQTTCEDGAGLADIRQKSEQAGKNETTSKHGQITPVYISTLPAQDSSDHVYSEVPEAVEATLSPHSATRELDSIMQELLGLQIELPDSPATSAPPPLVSKSRKDEQRKAPKDAGHDPAGGRKSSAAKDSDQAPEKTTTTGASIDDLLGDLRTDMEKMGVRTSAKGLCAACDKCIVGKMITALGQVWHPEHFACTSCGTELGICGFFERDGKPYCEKDYQKLFSPRCAYCLGPILQNILTAMDHTWHPEHFFCNHCGDVFGTEGFLERDGKPYCKRDFYRLFAPKCSGCGEPVQENYLSAANGTWHPDCFVCADCLSPFRDGCFMELDGRPLCALHYHSRQGMLCGGCGTPVLGRCIAALDRKFHPEHFVCAFCLRQLSQGIFKEQAGKPYCSTCHEKLFL